MSERASGATLVVGQSGGATAVINASLVGVVEGALTGQTFRRVVGMRHGIAGVLRGDLVDLSGATRGLLNGIRRTPSAALGTDRHRLTDEEIEPVLATLRELGATALVYIGGNDSADTVQRLGEAATRIGYDLATIAVPKTIDNDLPVTDHCPGYGSIARYIANAVRDATYDSLASPQLYPVKFVEVMGRDAGWVAASAGLGFGDGEGDLTPLIYLPERPPESLESVLAEIERRVRERGFVVAVVPETLRDGAGRPLAGQVGYVDAFGHPYPASPAAFLAASVTSQLRLRARYEKPGTAARMSISLASAVDLDEAYEVGWRAADLAADGARNLMVTLERINNHPYQSTTGTTPVSAIAHQVNVLPDAFIGEDGRSLTDAYRDYALPLLGPEPFPLYTRLS